MKKIFILLLLIALSIVSFAKKKNGSALIYQISTPSKITSKTPIVILLHGYGSNEADLFDLKKIMPKNVIFVCARAPISNGDNSFKWYKIDRNAQPTKEDKEGAAASMQKVLLLMAQLKSQYKTNGKVILGGFSQGAILSNAILAQHPQNVQGIISLSGRLMNGIVPVSKSPAIYKKIKVLQIHGTQDQVITIDKGNKVAEWLQKIGVQHQYKKLAMAHEINPEALEIIRVWLLQFS